MQTQKKKKKEREREGEGEGEKERKVTKSLRSFFLPHLGRIFPFNKTLIQQWGGRIETVQVWKEHKGFE